MKQLSHFSFALNENLNLIGDRKTRLTNKRKTQKKQPKTGRKEQVAQKSSLVWAEHHINKSQKLLWKSITQ